MTLSQAKEKLEKYGQEHVLKYYDELSEREKEGLLTQIEATDMSILESCKHREELARKGEITPLAAMQLTEKYYGLGYDVEDCPPPAGYKDYNEWLVGTKLSLEVSQKVTHFCKK